MSSKIANLLPEPNRLIITEPSAVIMLQFCLAQTEHVISRAISELPDDLTTIETDLNSVLTDFNSTSIKAVDDLFNFTKSNYFQQWFKTSDVLRDTDATNTIRSLLLQPTVVLTVIQHIVNTIVKELTGFVKQLSKEEFVKKHKILQELMMDLYRWYTKMIEITDYSYQNVVNTILDSVYPLVTKYVSIY